VRVYAVGPSPQPALSLFQSAGWRGPFGQFKANRLRLEFLGTAEEAARVRALVYNTEQSAASPAFTRASANGTKMGAEHQESESSQGMDEARLQRTTPAKPVAPVSVMLVDDHPLFREAVGRVIERSQDYRIVAEVGDGEEAISIAARISPRIIVLDIGLPKVNGIEATRRIKALRPETAVVVLSVHDDAEHVTAMLKAGADAYLTKDVMGAEILEALRHVTAGKMFLCSTALHHLVSLALSGGSPTNAAAEQELSRREQEILALMARGYSNRQMAEKLSLSTATVKGHVEGIFTKLNVDSRTEAVTTALRLGILELGDI